MADSHANVNRSFRTPRPTHVAPAHTPAPTADAEPQAHVNLERCRLSLIKGEHRWRFRWEPGCEAALISAVADLARNPRMNFDWFDAAVVCRHIAQGLPARAHDGAVAAPSASSSVSARQK
jgi:hypothetical protein